MQEDVALPLEMDGHAHQSRFMWMLHALEPYALFLPVAALIAFVVVLMMIMRGKGPAMVGVILLVVPLPIYVVLYAALSGTTEAFAVIGMADTEIKQSELLGFFAEVLITIQSAVLFTVPILLLAIIGLIIRALHGELPRPEPSLAAKN